MIDFSVILVEPEHPHNVGFVARAMRSNALSDLRIVYKQKSHVMEDSFHTAHNSKEVLNSAKIFRSLRSALFDSSFSVAFSRRIFDSVIPFAHLPEIKEKLPKEGRVALVFGRESKGLLVEEIEQCAFICEIPVAGNMSLNLAQAVSVVCYELCRSGLLSEKGFIQREVLKNGKKEPVRIEEMQQFLVFLKDRLSKRYQNLSWTDASINELLQRLQPTRFEMDALFGMVRSLSGSSARKEKEKNGKI